MRFALLRSSRPGASHKKNEKQSLSGFSLVELSVTVTILGIVATFGLEAMASFIERTNGQVTRERLTAVDEALRNYFRVYGRLPCPAARATAPAAATYGLEDCTIAAITNSNPATAPRGSNVGGGILFGAVPFRTLNIPMLQSGDGWNNKINYVVTKNLTNAGTGTSLARFGTTYTASNATNNGAQTLNDGLGGIEVRTGRLEESCSSSNCQKVANPTYHATDNPSPNGAAYVLFSNGNNQRGAISVRGVARDDCAAAGSNDTLKIDTQNCINADASAIATSSSTPANGNVTSAIPRNVFYDARFNNGLSNLYYFDDYVVWRQRVQL